MTAERGGPWLSPPRPDADAATAPAPPAPAEAASVPELTVDLGALADNWRALDRASEGAVCAAVVKADAYGLGIRPCATALAKAGARTFFVAQPQEGARLREVLGPGPEIFVFNGFMPSDAEAYRGRDLRPVLNSPFQIAAFRAAFPDRADRPACGLHIESGINRLGLTSQELDELRATPPRDLDVTLVMSHLACADDPNASMNARQRGAFAGRAALARALAPGARLSLSATGGALLGPAFRFDMVRPGVGLYGGLPFADARPVAHLSAPILQLRTVPAGEGVGYGASWVAARDTRVAVLPLGYADGLHRAVTGGRTSLKVWLEGRPAPVIGRVSMDMITVDVTGHAAARTGAMVEVLGDNQSVDDVAAAAGTIGYEVLTSLGARYARRYTGA